MNQSRLLTQLGAILRRERQFRELTQAQVAQRAGMSQAALGRIEQGLRATGLPTFERLFAALDLQLRVELDPLDADVDAAIDNLLAVPVAERIDELALDVIAETLGDVPAVFDGPTAALLQGAPLPSDDVHLAVPWSAAEEFTAWLSERFAHRWHPQWREYGHLPLNPHHPAPHRWRTRDGVIHARMVDEPPADIEVRDGARGYRVVPLADLTADDERTARLLARFQQRRRSRPTVACQSILD